MYQMLFVSILLTNFVPLCANVIGAQINTVESLRAEILSIDFFFIAIDILSPVGYDINKVT